LYVTDSANQTIRKITLATTEVTTLAGKPGVVGNSNGTGAAASFKSPIGIATDGTNLFVSDSDNHTLRKIVIATGAVSTLAGTAGSLGNTDGSGAAARFYYPFGVATDGSSLYVADRGYHLIRKIR
jgi:sugar lactone lactonase YvrE